MASVSTLSEEKLRKFDEFSDVMDVAACKAIADNRRLGIPMYREIGGAPHWELPDGTLVTEDPWHGKNTPPEDWPFGEEQKVN